MPGPVVRGTFSPARAWRPAAVARLARTLGFRIRFPQAQVLCKWNEVPVRVQESQPVFDAPRRNQRVNGLPDSDALPAQKSVVFRSL